jgi:hypothetical protein
LPIVARRGLGALLDAFTTQECANFFASAGFGPD